jgi:phosphoribosylglycinamide formyltransferase-1
MNLAVLGSGKGSNLQSMIDAIQGGRLNARIVLVMADVADAYILERARRAGIPAEFMDCNPYRTKLDGAAESAVIRRLNDARVECVALAGFMRIVKQGLLQAFPHRVVNIHPSLLPAFPGLEAWRQAVEHGVKVSGCTVHFVDGGMDTGPIILQKPVPVLDGDTPATLHARIQEQEHVAYPEALQLVADGRVVVDGRRVVVTN